MNQVAWEQGTAVYQHRTKADRFLIVAKSVIEYDFAAVREINSDNWYAEKRINLNWNYKPTDLDEATAKLIMSL